MWHSFKPHQSQLSIEEREIVFSIIHRNIRHPHHCFSPQIWWNSQQKLPFSTPLQFSGATQTLPYIFLHSLEIFWFILYFIVAMHRITIWGSISSLHHVASKIVKLQKSVGAKLIFIQVSHWVIAPMHSVTFLWDHLPVYNVLLALVSQLALI